MKLLQSLSMLATLALAAPTMAEQATESNTSPAKAPVEYKWRDVNPHNAVQFTFAHGDVILELSPEFAPNHVEQFKSLVKSGFYDGESFYRVIDGFVAQAGPADGSEKDKKVTTLKMEEEIAVDENWPFTLTETKDMFAPQTGYKNGFAIGYAPEEKKAWLLHCPGVIAMARSNDPDTGSSHFYITNGQATRYLDRIMAVFGRVVYGMDKVQMIKRTAVIEGDTPVDKAQFTSIVKAQLLADVAPEKRRQLQVQNTDSAHFKESLEKRRNRTSPFFYKPSVPVLDVCQAQARVRIKPTS